MNIVKFLILNLILLNTFVFGIYQVKVERLNTIQKPLPAISRLIFKIYFKFINKSKLKQKTKKSQEDESVFKYAYNCAYVPIFNDNGSLKHHALIARCQNLQNSSNIYQVGPSKLAFATMIQNQFNENNITFTKITNDSVIFEPDSPLDNFGTEDPRIAYDSKEKIYYMTYSAVQQYSNGTVISRLALATSKTPWIKSSWIRHGAIFPSLLW